MGRTCLEIDNKKKKLMIGTINGKKPRGPRQR